jgi:hypothetical protein
MAILRDIYSGAGADRVSALRHDRLYGGGQLVSCHAAAGYGISCDGDAAGLGGIVLSLSIFCDSYGWRSAFLALGIALWLLVVIPGLIFLRRQPEDLGLLPDGMAPSDRQLDASEHLSAIASSETSWKRADALRTGTLWLLMGSAFLASIGTGGRCWCSEHDGALWRAR